MNTTKLGHQLQIPTRCLNSPKKNPATSPYVTTIHSKSPKKYSPLKATKNSKASLIPDEHGVFPPPRLVALGAVSLGFALLLMGVDGHHQALALGPEGPLMEDFWDNIRRYALYALTVSTGALYTILLPIFELLKNKISAVLVVVILGSGFYIVSHVLYAMVRVTDFSYDYGH